MSELQQVLQEIANKFEVPLAEKKTESLNSIMVFLGTDSRRMESLLPKGS